MKNSKRSAAGNQTYREMKQADAQSLQLDRTVSHQGAKRGEELNYGCRRQIGSEQRTVSEVMAEDGGNISFV